MRGLEKTNGFIFFREERPAIKGCSICLRKSCELMEEKSEKES